ncbi:hypothetical protein MKEN_00286400 [Mycena kentingensis (nom. inval.)]|nr:hypothetical protein MKEN_00286400 [Mycena kentingensis (nom. inval.)]
MSELWPAQLVMTEGTDADDGIGGEDGSNATPTNRERRAARMPPSSSSCMRARQTTRRRVSAAGHVLLMSDLRRAPEGESVGAGAEGVLRRPAMPVKILDFND